jgi:hypothetical protein
MGKGAFLSACGGAFVGAIALMTASASSALAQTTGIISDPRIRVEALRVEARPEIIVTETHIAILKNILNLRPEQEPYWVPVEAALGELARWQAKKASESGTAGRTSNRKAADVNAKKQLKRIAAVSAPLIRALDENQRRDVITLARAFGFERLVASF